LPTNNQQLPNEQPISPRIHRSSPHSNRLNLSQKIHYKSPPDKLSTSSRQADNELRHASPRAPPQMTNDQGRMTKDKSPSGGSPAPSSSQSKRRHPCVLHPLSRQKTFRFAIINQ